ncbi:tetratricopeptide repeat protein [Patescibacteria group bacterium]|nr:tetratricopeptide repeat protein [Patescibacteria group bacterium]
MEQHLGAVITGQEELVKRPLLAKVLGSVVDVCLYTAVVLVPLFFIPLAPDVLEIGKQTLLAVLMSVALVAWLGQALSVRSFSLARSWLHLVVAVFILGYLGTSLASSDRYLSLAGNFGQMQWAFATVLAFAAFYLLMSNVVKETAKLYHFLLAFLASSTLVGLIGFLSLVGLHPFGWVGDFAAQQGFNTIGNINSFGVYMTIPLVLGASLMVLGCKDRACILGRKGSKSVAAKVLVWASIAVAFLVAVVIDFWVIWAAILFGTALIVAIPLVRSRRIDKPVQLIVPGLLVAVSVILILFRSPIDLNLPAEVSPSAAASWSIARQTLQDAPLFGSGPGTWINDYAMYRSPAVNLSQFWSVRFERGISTFLTLLATIGLIGMALWLMLLVSAVGKSALHLSRERDGDAWQAYLTVFTGWATVAFISFIYNYNVSHHFVFWFLLALLASLVGRGSFTWDMRKSAVNSAIVSLLFILLCVGSVSVLWLSGQRMVAEARFVGSVQMYNEGQPIKDAITKLESAITLNGNVDTYYRNLSQAYLIYASQEMQVEPDEERTKRVNDAISSAVTVAQKATEISPRNVNNWANLALVLQSISSFSRGADEKAMEMYQEAMKREPNNPTFMNEIGKLHLLRSDAYRTLLESTDEAVKQDAEASVKLELDLAAEALNQSIAMKADYAPAHYNLGLVYERQDRVQDAIVKLEQVLSVEQQNVGVAFQLSILYYRNNEKDKSRIMLEQIVSMDPTYSNARWYLASLYEEEGKIDEAIDQVQRVADLNPGEETVTKRLDALMQMRDAKLNPSPVPLPEPVPEPIANPPGQEEVTTP